MRLVSWAQAREDIYLLRALRGIRHDLDNAFYIDVGANDPEIDSVTKLFYDQGWHGINVEPSPGWFRRIAAQRPRDINIQAAISDTPGELVFHDDAAGGLGTLVKDIADGHQAARLALQELTVRSVTLTELCERYAPKDIHFLKIDVEGAEGAVLRSMDFTRFRPWVLCIECHLPLRIDLQTYAAWEPLVLDAGYRFVFTDQINRFYLAAERADRAVNFAVPVDEFMTAGEFRRLRDLERRVLELEQEVSASRAPAAMPAPSAGGEGG